MPWLAAAGLAVSVVSSLFGASAAKKAARKAKRLAGMNADYINAETDEQKRRLKFEQSQTTATTKSNLAASGFRSGAASMGGSRSAYLKTMKTQQQSEMDWLTQSGESRSKIAREGGNVAASQLKSQSFGQYAQAGKSLFGLVDEIRNG